MWKYRIEQTPRPEEKKKRKKEEERGVLFTLWRIVGDLLSDLGDYPKAGADEVTLFSSKFGILALIFPASSQISSKLL